MYYMHLRNGVGFSQEFSADEMTIREGSVLFTVLQTLLLIVSVYVSERKSFSIFFYAQKGLSKCIHIMPKA